MTEAVLTAIQGGAKFFRGEGFMYEYPTKESRPTSAGFGYASDMLALAVNNDDPKAFMTFLDEAGGLEVECLIAGSIVNYAALHGATECIKALFAAGAQSDYPQRYWLTKAENPFYGPRANRLA